MVVRRKAVADTCQVVWTIVVLPTGDHVAVEINEYRSIQAFLDEVGKPGLREYLRLEPGSGAAEASAAVRKRKRWAQAQLANPRYESEARFVLRNQHLMERVLLVPEARETADAHAKQLRAFWMGLTLAGLAWSERLQRTRGESQRLGVPPARVEELLVVGRLTDPEDIATDDMTHNAEAAAWDWSEPESTHAPPAPAGHLPSFSMQIGGLDERSFDQSMEHTADASLPRIELSSSESLPPLESLTPASTLPPLESLPPVRLDSLPPTEPLPRMDSLPPGERLQRLDSLPPTEPLPRIDSPPPPAPSPGATGFSTRRRAPEQPRMDLPRPPDPALERRNRAARMLAQRMTEVMRDGRLPITEIEDLLRKAREQNLSPDATLARLEALIGRRTKRPSGARRGPPKPQLSRGALRKALQELTDTLRGLTAQGLLDDSGESMLHRLGRRRGLDKGQVTSLLADARDAVELMEAGRMDPFRELGLRAGATVGQAREAWQTARGSVSWTGALWAEAHRVVRMDAAWAVIVRRSRQKRR
jgi:hypothetical protein